MRTPSASEQETSNIAAGTRVRLEPGFPVWARRSHGLIRRVPCGMFGTVFAVRDDGKVVVEWFNGRTSAHRPDALDAGSDVNPWFATRIDYALAALPDEPARPWKPYHDPGFPTEWNRGWDACLEAVREQLVIDGLLPEDKE